MSFNALVKEALAVLNVSLSKPSVAILLIRPFLPSLSKKLAILFANLLGVKSLGDRLDSRLVYYGGGGVSFF